MFNTMLVSLVFTLLAFWAGWLCRRWYVTHRTPQEQRSGVKVCGICGESLAVSARRTHDGLWRCSRHKGVA